MFLCTGVIAEQSMCNNSAFLCLNLSQEHCTVIELSAGLTNLSVSLLCVVIILFLSLKLKSGVYNSAVKRVSFIFAISVTLSALNAGLLEIYNDFAPVGWCVVAFFIATFTTIVLLFYLSIVLAMLLLQIWTPLVPERWKQTLKPKIHTIEEIIHLIILILSLSYATEAVFFDNFLTMCRDHKCIEGKDQLGFIIFSYASLVIPLIILIIAILFLGYICIKFRRNKTVTRRTKWPLFKLSILSLLLTTELAMNVFVYYLNLTTLIIEEVFFSLIRLAVLLMLLALVYLPSIQRREWCKCFKRACDQAPLLPNSGLQHTNPESVWDHANVPSVTVTNLPPEMSDCETDATHHELQHETETITYACSRNTPKYGSVN